MAAGCNAGIPSPPASGDASPLETHVAPAEAGTAAPPPLGHSVSLRVRYLDVVVAPDDAHVASSALDEETDEPGVAVFGLGGVKAGALEHFFALPAEPVAWLDARRCLLWADATKTAYVVDIGSGATTPLEARQRPLLGADRSLLVTVDATSRVRVVDAATLATRATIDAPVTKDASVTLGAGDSMVVIADEDASTLATLDGAVRGRIPLGTHSSDPTGLSPSGRYIARWVMRPDIPAMGLALFDVGANKELHRSPLRLEPTAAAFGPGETFAVVAMHPSELTLVALPSGQTRTLRSTVRYDDAEFGTIVENLGVTADGRYVCARLASGMRKYSSCNDTLLFDLRTQRTPPPAAGYRACHVDGGVATLVSFPPGQVPFSAGYEAVGSGSATYTHVCNHTISSDRSLVAVVESPSQGSDLEYERANLLVIRTNGELVRRFALGSAPRGMGASLETSFSPGGRYLAAKWGPVQSVYDLETGEAVPTGGGFERWADRDASFVTGPGVLHSSAAGRVIALQAAAGDAPRVPSCVVGSRVVPRSACAAGRGARR